MKIIQIVIDSNDLILGLGDDGKIYYWNKNMNAWTEYKQ